MLDQFGNHLLLRACMKAGTTAMILPVCNASENLLLLIKNHGVGNDLPSQRCLENHAKATHGLCRRRALRKSPAKLGMNLRHARGQSWRMQDLKV